ncbi:hypothetical protein ACVIIV_003926 [Bradyrhizobium sp. USDA 4354]
MLTYMATVEDALRGAGLELYELPDWETRQPIRQLWIEPSFWNWFDTDPLHDEDLKIGGKTIGEHIEQMFCDLRCSERPGGGDLKRMRPTNKGVWKFHPAGARLYGWAAKEECMVVVTGALEAETKDKTRADVNDQRCPARSGGYRYTIV